MFLCNFGLGIVVVCWVGIVVGMWMLMLGFVVV